MKANLFYPEGAGRLPVVVFAATGHADYSLKDDWHLLNEDLARLGFVSLAVAFNQFSASELEALFQYLAGLEMVDPSRIAFVGAMRATRFVVQAAIANKAVRALVLISSAKIPEIGLLVDRPVLIVCSKGETFAPTLAIARQIADQLTGQRQVVVLPGKSSGVNVLETDWNQFRAETLEWLRRFLLP
jgi:pimeloyl-ACP methyl ester carboxylesterase